MSTSLIIQAIECNDYKLVYKCIKEFVYETSGMLLIINIIGIQEIINSITIKDMDSLVGFFIYDLTINKSRLLDYFPYILAIIKRCSQDSEITNIMKDSLIALNSILETRATGLVISKQCSKLLNESIENAKKSFFTDAIKKAKASILPTENDSEPLLRVNLD